MQLASNHRGNQPNGSSHAIVQLHTLECSRGSHASPPILVHGTLPVYPFFPVTPPTPTPLPTHTHMHVSWQGSAYLSTTEQPEPLVCITGSFQLLWESIK